MTQLFVKMLYLSIKLGVVAQHEAHINPQFPAEWLPATWCELYPPVRYYVLRDGKLRNMWWNKAVPVSIAVGRLFRGTSLHAPKKQSTAKRMVVKQWEFGKSMAKSMAIWAQGQQQAF